MNSTGREPPHDSLFRRLFSRLVYSRLGGVVAQYPPLSWIIRWLARTQAQRHIGQVPGQSRRELPVDLESALNSIVYDVVEILGYAGAMVATYEPSDALPVRALYIDPHILSKEQLEAWIGEVSDKFSPRRLSLTDPEIARVYVHNDAYKDNLGVRAAHLGGPLVSERLFDLFTPVAPPASGSAIDGIQQALGIRQVITMPFFLPTKLDGEPHLEYVGNLFAAKRSEISAEDINLLSAFARQVSTAILSERRQMRANIIQQLILDIHHSLGDEDQILQRIARGVVDDLGYAGAMVATYEPGDVLPVRAFYVDPAMIDMQHIDAWVDEISTRFAGRRLSLDDPTIARVYLHQDAYQGNLSTKAAKERRPVVSNRLFDLFTPIAPDGAASAIDGIQQALGIHQVITVPFFIENSQDGKVEREFVGNLFAATRARQFQAWEIELLGMFGQQAAAGLKNARTYRRSEARRVTAEIFGKMAFSATASLHAFRNSIGAIRMSVQLIELLRTSDGGLNDDVWNKQYPDLNQRLDRLTELLEGLHEPFRQARDVAVNINDCLKYALTRIEAPEGWLELSLAKDLPNVYTLAEMLTEAIKVLLKNALEALHEKEQAGTLPKGEPVLFISSRLTEDGQVEAVVRDCGTGIRPEMLSKLFDLGATTKNSGMGFGLFWTKDYIEGLGGSITLETKVGEGTTFRIRLPVKKESEQNVTVATV